MKTVIKAEIVAHSRNQQGDELISVLATFPRIILAEMNTHRMLSKNTSSSRAIPFNKMVETIQNDPFIPIAWQKEHKGMQGSEYFTSEFDIELLRQNWLKGRDYAVITAKAGTLLGSTKQLNNRLLEPFMWTTMLITGPKSGWENFFHLRCPSYETNSGKGFRSRRDALAAQLNVKDPGKDFVKQSYEEGCNIEWFLTNKGQAEIHMMALAEAIYDAVSESTPKQLKPGEWHIPFRDKIDLSNFNFGMEAQSMILQKHTRDITKVKISVAMAARTSYTVVGEEKGLDYEALIGLHDRLLSQDPPHSSPFEHTCQVVTEKEYNNSFKGQEKGWFRNYKGFKSYRQIVEENK